MSRQRSRFGPGITRNANNWVMTFAGTDGVERAITVGSDVTLPQSVGGFSSAEITGTSQTAAANTIYIANNASLVTVTLPDTAAIGDIVEIVGKGAGGWKLAQNAGETIYFGTATTTTGTGGSLASTNRRDVVRVVCITANTDWEVNYATGSLTVT